MQLALAVALQQHLLTGATKKPLAYDPGFEPGDVDLLERLGFEVAGCEPHHTVSCSTLFYMPCCPRQLYSDVLVSRGGGRGRGQHGGRGGQEEGHWTSCSGLDGNGEGMEGHRWVGGVGCGVNTSGGPAARKWQQSCDTRTQLVTWQAQGLHH